MDPCHYVMPVIIAYSNNTLLQTASSVHHQVHVAIPQSVTVLLLYCNVLLYRCTVTVLLYPNVCCATVYNRTQEEVDEEELMRQLGLQLEQQLQEVERQGLPADVLAR